MIRPSFIRCLASIFLLPALAGLAATAAATEDARKPVNLLLLTADDLHWDSVGAFGCAIPGITPNIDRLAAEGMRFRQAHVTVPVCMPTRAVWMTGRYSHNNGALGFEEIREGVPTLVETLKTGGYATGLMGKVGHVVPSRHAAFDYIVPEKDLGAGRDPALYGARASAFFRQAAEAGKPFFLMANSHDPHRPFAGSDQEKMRRRRPAGPLPSVRRTIEPQEVSVPGFLPDLPPVRLEVAEYFTSVHRADESAGAVLKALDDAGLRETTLVMFLSDHGMSFPFSKTNCYRFGTQTPWIVRWPGAAKPGAVDDSHFISGIDLAPTLLEAAGLPALPGADGRTFLPLLKGGRQEGREQVYTQFHRTSGRRDYFTRALHDRRWGYIYNPWSDGVTEYRNEGQNGRTWNAMVAAAADSPAIASRVHHYLYRTTEELYDYEKDPHALVNLAADPAQAGRRREMRQRMKAQMELCRDPLIAGFEEMLRAAP